eukprot:TRINITY_DN62206_c0_g1_i1.p1 TRINITY_DN62206_c0_g1~~TRINITY_DN62206_c0_g1_i1.p1  ORF type:complete len:664 (+),score=76.22 TRINITY_DN62206_c0_g1_i1:24-1994(+)
MVAATDAAIATVSMAHSAEDPKNTSLDIAFEGLYYEVQVKNKKASKIDNVSSSSKMILNNICGACCAGKVTAIMGPSGAGKTSLLDILAGRRASTSGEVSLGSKRQVDAATIRKYAAYVQQDDAIMATQTTKEALTMAAFLTLPQEMSKIDKLQQVEKIMRTFHLEGCADTMVGDPVGKTKGLSGGERKRCAVAMCAIREPHIFFLDEPTSGLDAYKAFLLMDVLKRLAREQNSTIVTTIHQPSSDIYALFDNLMLLLGGHVVFCGPAVDAVTHFANIGYACPTYANPADYLFMHVLTNQDGSSADDSRCVELQTAWATSEGDTKRKALVDSLLSTATTGKIENSVTDVRQKASFWTQFSILFLRGANDIRRNVLRGRAFIAQCTVMALILSLIWLQVGNDQKGLQDRTGILFFITTNAVMQNVVGVLTTFGSERGAVIREQENGMYNTLPYFLSRVLVDLPIKILGPCVFGTITYWLVGFQPSAEKFFTFIGFLILMGLAGNAMGLCLACLFQDIAIALAVAPMFILPLIMFSGFVLNPDSIPVYFRWCEWISPAKYAFAALAQNEFTELDIHCSEDQFQSVRSPDGEVMRVCRFESGEAFLNTLNISEFLTIEVCAGLLLAIAVSFTIMAYIGFSIVTSRSQAKNIGKSKTSSD